MNTLMIMVLRLLNGANSFKILPKERLEINIKYIEADKRVFEINSIGEHYKQIKEVLNDDNITN